MNDVLNRAACDFEDDALRRQDLAKDIENEIAIMQCRRRIFAVVAHHGFRSHGSRIADASSPVANEQGAPSVNVRYCAALASACR